MRRGNDGERVRGDGRQVGGGARPRAVRSGGAVREAPKGDLQPVAAVHDAAGEERAGGGPGWWTVAGSGRRRGRRDVADGAALPAGCTPVAPGRLTVIVAPRRRPRARRRPTVEADHVAGARARRRRRVGDRDRRRRDLAPDTTANGAELRTVRVDRRAHRDRLVGGRCRVTIPRSVTKRSPALTEPGAEERADRDLDVRVGQLPTSTPRVTSRSVPPGHAGPAVAGQRDVNVPVPDSAAEMVKPTR